jgi:general secretion pathway protein K
VESAPLSPARTDRGMILVIVLWTLSALTAIVVALGSYTQKNIVHAGLEADVLYSDMALLSGIEVGKAIILATPPDARQFIHEGNRRYDVGEGRTVEISIENTSGLLDINRAPPELIGTLAKTLQTTNPGAGDLLAAVAEFRIQQAKSRESKGDKKKFTRINALAGLQTPLFFSTGQLIGINGATSEIIEDVLPLITLYSADGKINPLIAPASILESVPKLTIEDMKILLSAQTQRRSPQSRAVLDIIAKHAAYFSIGRSNVFSIRVKLLNGPHTLPGQQIRVIGMLGDKAETPFHTLALSW